MLVLLKNHLNYLKDSIFECSLREYNFYLFKKKIFFLQHIMMNSVCLAEKSN